MGIVGILCAVVTNLVLAQAGKDSAGYFHVDSIILKQGELALRIDPEVGGRVASLMYRGKELLFTRDTEGRGGNNWGSTFWLSPQTLWGWPPVANHDNAPYKILSLEANSVGMESRKALGARVCKQIRLSNTDPGSVTLDYVINAQEEFAQVAGWEVTRVPRSGLVFYPVHKHSLATVMGAVDYRLDTDNVVWIDLDKSEALKEGKLNANGREGWLAWVEGRRVFIKVYEPVPGHSVAEGEGDVEVYLSGIASYVELEVQSAAQALNRGDQLRWQVQWLVHELPLGLEASAGSKALVQFVRRGVSALNTPLARAGH
jgi:hypothetical protein